MLVARSELSYYPTEAYEVKREPMNKVKKEIKNIRQKKNNSVPKLVFLTMPVIILGVSLFILFGYARITAVRIDITELEYQKNELEKTRLNLVADLEGLKSSSKISEDAVLKLGMDYPTEGQIVYVTVNDNSIEYIEKASIGKHLKKIFSMVTNLF